MKNIIKTVIGFALAGSLFSCAKDEIEVLKNLDTSWEVDKSIRDKDLRNRFGLDPRYNYALSEVNEFDFPMLHLGDFQITGERTNEFEVKILNPLDKDLTVTLNYDAAMFEKVKEKYSDYELGAENVVKIAEKQKVIPRGETSVKFRLAVDNDSRFGKSVVVPFSFTTNDDSIKLLEGRTHFLAKVFKKEITYNYPNRINKFLILSNQSLFPPRASLNIEASDVVSQPIEFSVERADGKGLPNLAPEGVEGQLPAPINMEGEQSGVFGLTLDVNSVEEGSVSQLPLQIVATMNGQRYVLPNTITLVIDTSVPADENVVAGKKEKGKAIDKEGLVFTGTLFPEFYDENIFDGQYKFGVPISGDATMEITLPSAKTIGSLKFTIPTPLYAARFQGGDVYAVDNQGEEVMLGSVDFSKEEGNSLIALLKVPVHTQKLLIKNIQKSGGNWIELSEIDLYEE
ncbi:DUF1735 domain-containing protein [Capnocytophaga stomatis]|uniref:DUF1735 domain-containing protein n=1 Tax=Capnocytophaga stomatis TaxID=1848904 RepID=A0ABW8Q6X3_9FLAO|nr:DUF1735 domain-containing protein [Capnocytophaga stomatis]GIJ93509.1 hypothetical protein CAPN002_07270 [Capnocytophaga stomatis]